VIKQRQADLDFISTHLPRLHVNFFYQLNPTDFNAAVQSLSAQIPNLTDEQLAVRLAQLVAMAGDEHTYLNLASIPGLQTQHVSLARRQRSETANDWMACNEEY
jgi:hypothetical protein